MKQCRRCYRWHRAKDSGELCESCWEDIGQLQFWQDQDDDVEADQFAEHPSIDTVFDREEEARGYQ